MSNAQELFYLRDSRSNVGSSAMFWAIKGGYTSDLSKAEKFTRERAVSQYNIRETDIPVRCDLADANAYRAVDMQNLPDECATDDLLYLVIKNRFDGNNVLFIGGSHNKSHDLSLIQPVTKEIAYQAIEQDRQITCYPVSAIESIARPVVNADLIDTSMVLRKAKIKMVKVKRYRPTKGLTRHNCPECGRIVWHGNPYEPAYCKEHSRNTFNWCYA